MKQGEDLVEVMQENVHLLHGNMFPYFLEPIDRGSKNWSVGLEGAPKIID